MPEYCVELSMPAAFLRLPLPQDGMLVGRDPSCDLVLRSREVSRRHVMLLPDEGGVRVRDCGATNPTMVNGRPLKGEEVFEPGLELCVSSATFRVLREPAA
jgi:pSer/pThr/pTyr-binding forkhead associated (FHA) protein